MFDLVSAQEDGHEHEVENQQGPHNGEVKVFKEGEEKTEKKGAYK